jgi:hypothetical protein
MQRCLTLMTVIGVLAAAAQADVIEFDAPVSTLHTAGGGAMTHIASGGSPGGYYNIITCHYTKMTYFLKIDVPASGCILTMDVRGDFTHIDHRLGGQADIGKIGGGTDYRSYSMGLDQNYTDWTTVQVDLGSLGYTPDKLKQIILRYVPSGYDIDNIGLVPEPAALGLLALGGLALIRRRRTI